MISCGHHRGQWTVWNNVGVVQREGVNDRDIRSKWKKTMSHARLSFDSEAIFCGLKRSRSKCINQETVMAGNGSPAHQGDLSNVLIVMIVPDWFQPPLLTLIQHCLLWCCLPCSHGLSSDRVTSWAPGLHQMDQTQDKIIIDCLITATPAINRR